VLGQMAGIMLALKEPAPNVFLVDYGEYGLKFQAFFYVGQLADKAPAKDVCLTGIAAAFRKAGIKMAYPAKLIAAVKN
jgi:small-conductance mechanosensitive channel